MKLHELHVAELGPRAKGHGVSVGRGDRRIGRFAVKLPRATGREHDGSRPDEREAAAAIPHQHAAAFAFVGDQVDCQAVFPDPDVRPRPCFGDHCAHDFSTGLVTQRVDDPGMRMPPFQAQRDMAVDLVEMSSPPDQLADPVGCLAHNHLDDFRIAQALARRERIGDVVVEPVVGIEHARDAPLGIVAVALAQLVLGHDEHAVMLGDAQSAAKSGNPAADDQNIGEMVRKVPQVEGDEVPAR